MAAAYAALVSLMNDLDLIPNHPRHSFSFDNNQIQPLLQTVHFLIEFMETYDSYEFLESRIASAAHAAYDVVHSHVADQIHAGSTLLGKPRSYFLLDLQKAVDNMNYVKRKATDFKAKSRTNAEQPTCHPPTSTSSAAQTSKKNKMVGFDSVLTRLMGMLTGEPSNRLVIPIEGMGGMGKTTLAKNAYEHKISAHHYDIRCWATISQDYIVENILTQLLPEKQNYIGRNVTLLGLELREKLWGRRYLVVLDDMWNIDVWDEIQAYFPDNGNGSRVIVTTRLSKLANCLSTSPYKMDFLDNDQSWELFCVETFDVGKCPFELEKFGRKIVGRCQGLPLSIIVIAGHLRKSTRAVEYWKKFSSFMNPISSSEEGDKCMKIISLSYHHLPILLKPCFLYIGKFKEDEQIHVATLLKFWVAEGLIKPREGLSLEKEAEDCLNNLIDRNLVIVRRRRWNGKPKYCGIHDIVREFCLKVGRKERFLGMVHTKVGESRERRIVKQNSDKWLLEFRSLRASEYEERNIRADNVSWVTANFQQVNLRYLRYRSISFKSEIYNLPCSISLLWNLQTLILDASMETRAPQEIWAMTQLRHLQIRQLYLPDSLQECIVLRNLRTLETIRNLTLMEKICKRMPNIKELSLNYDSKFFSDWHPQNLHLFNKLESLTARLSRPALVTLPLSLPSSLEELDLEVPGLHWEDLGTMFKSLHRLGFLRLSGVEGHEWSLVDEEFPCLKHLEISACGDLIHWNADSTHFPALRTLSFLIAFKLSEIPFDIGEIPSLARINLIYCSVSAAVSAMRIMVKQEGDGNEDFQLNVDFGTMDEIDRFQEILQQQDIQSKSLPLFCHSVRSRFLKRLEYSGVPF